MSLVKSTNDDQDQCPICKAHLQLLRISKAAKLADVSSKTIYRYVEEGNVYAVKIAGKTLRVCRGCLLKPFSNE
jgi:hypothetical protein